MFPYEDRIKAVKLLIQYDMSYSDVTRILGYPSKESLRKWYQEYKKNDDLHSEFLQENKYRSEEKQSAVTYYLEHGKSVSRTVRKLGYPSRPTLDKQRKLLQSMEQHEPTSTSRNVSFFKRRASQRWIIIIKKYRSVEDLNQAN